ncbi:hypothetical protein KY342_03890 [Candidatus Woesearchaeota archaeon]|nr:hypothetical protein [Candidatus Woesearchaeota archaeon]
MAEWTKKDIGRRISYRQYISPEDMGTALLSELVLEAVIESIEKYSGNPVANIFHKGDDRSCRLSTLILRKDDQVEDVSKLTKPGNWCYIEGE